MQLGLSCLLLLSRYALGSPISYLDPSSAHALSSVVSLTAASPSHSLVPSASMVSRRPVSSGVPSQTSTPDNSSIPDTSNGTFVHPGVFVDKTQLDFVKDKVNSGQQPWTDAFNGMMKSEYASLSRNSAPREIVECGPTSNPDLGCKDERQDALSAYTQALSFYITGQTQNADKAVEYMNAWSGKIKNHTNSNAPLQTGWSAASWARAAEIIKYTYAGWKDEDVELFKNMLKTVYLPVVIEGSQIAGNWDLVMAEAAIGISIFLDDRDSYNKAMNKFMGRVPAYIYLKTDGDIPKAAPGSNKSGKDQLSKFWYDQKTFESDGIAQETCRDFVHTGYGLVSISHIAETSKIQGKDLYSEDVGERLKAGLEFHSNLMLNNPKPDWLCPGKDLKLNMEAITEVGFSAFSSQLGETIENTEKLTMENRPAGTNKLFVAWETLTNARDGTTDTNANNTTGTAGDSAMSTGTTATESTSAAASAWSAPDQRRRLFG